VILCRSPRQCGGRSGARKHKLGLRKAAVQSAVVCWLATFGASVAEATNINRPFTVVDDIETARFSGVFGGSRPSQVSISPDGNFAAVITERGSLSRNRIEDRLWIISRRQVATRLDHNRDSGGPHGLRPTLTAIARQGPVMTHVEWLSDSSGLAFLSPNEHGLNQLSVVSRSGDLRRLSAPDQNVTAFSLNHGQIAYSALSPIIARRLIERRHTDAFDATGQSLYNLLFTSDRFPDQSEFVDTLCDLWVVRRGRPVRVERHGEAVRLHQDFEPYGEAKFWISPDGTKLLVRRPVFEIPQAWEHFVPSVDLPARRIKAGRQSVEQSRLPDAVEVFEVLDLSTGALWRPTQAPIGRWDSYYEVLPSAAWSADSRSVILANTFIAPKLDPDGVSEGRPCVVVARLTGRRISCAFQLLSGRANYASLGIGFIDGVNFEDGNPNSIELQFVARADRAPNNGEVWSFRETQGRWVPGTRRSIKSDKWPFKLKIEEGLNQPPVLCAQPARNALGIRLLDPNADLGRVALGEAKLYQWRDGAGRTWSGVLVKPPGMVTGRRYPLVIQTHGFDASKFLTFGALTSAMAARELAARGILVLQVGGAANDDALYGTPEEGPLEVDGYSSAIKQLSDEGLVDKNRVGLVGFSRTVFGVMEAIVDGRLEITAAVIADGIQVSYPEYLYDVDYWANEGSIEFDSIMGARPFGVGLKTWLNRSPQFRLDKSTTPLLVFAHGASTLLEMWSPYAALRAMGKPTDLIVLNTGEHVLTEPKERLVSQGGSLDWFSFWLQGYEDPDPAKRDQYARWEGLCDMQRTQNPTRPAFCVGTRSH
jgi:dipeptidyl aminopeptidase/acylaminoacyl peptidase